MRKIVQRIKQSVVRVTGKAGAGSGFVALAGGIIATCRHCVEGSQPSDITVTLSDGTQMPVFAVVLPTDRSGGVLPVEKSPDVALLEIDQIREAEEQWTAKDDVKYPPLELGSWSEVDEGEEVLFCGYPMQLRFPLTQRAMVSAKTTVGPQGESVRYIWLDGSINFGNSGGPLVSIESGRVVGVISNKAGGLSDKLLKSIRFLREFRGVGIAFTKGGETVDAFKVLAESLATLHELANIGIGAAVEIDAGKELLYKELV